MFPLKMPAVLSRIPYLYPVLYQSMKFIRQSPPAMMPTAVTLGRRSLAVILLACMSVACQHPITTGDRQREATTANAEVQRTFVYECDGNISFTARTNSSTVWLFLREHSLQLARVASASGEKYASGTTGFSIDGQDAVLKNKEGPPISCRNNREQAVWEHAKLNGVDFRATGNEPGWHLEITLGQSMVLVTDYGSSSYRFDTPEPILDQSSRTSIYTTQRGKHRITVNLQGKPCIDSMSGRRYEVSATVQLDQQRYRGCGRALH